VATFHSAAATILRREAEKVGLTRSFVIYDETDQLHLVSASAVTLPAPLRDQGPRFLPGLPHENAGRSSLDPMRKMGSRGERFTGSLSHQNSLP
jgi:superfamily I DNA/RNA helicase